MNNLCTLTISAYLNLWLGEKITFIMSVHVMNIITDYVHNYDCIYACFELMSGTDSFLQYCHHGLYLHT